jgi:RimJ/RimL family protein N-acetyltransferase
VAFIETDRLLIRLWMESDIPAFAQIMGDPEVRRYLGGVLGRDQVADRIRVQMERQERDEPAMWPVILKSNGELIGDCGLQPLPGFDRIEIGWRFARAYWGQGLAFEASRAVLDHALSGLQLASVVAVIAPENRRSIALANRLHMRFDRIVRAYKRDLMMYESVRTG